MPTASTRYTLDWYTARLPSPPPSIPVRAHLTRHEFLRDYAAPNLPVLLAAENTRRWRACRDWVDPTTGGPDLAYLARHFGECKVQVAHCDEQWFSDQRREDMSVADFCARWDQERNEATTGWLGYAKDWHFVRQVPKYKAYSVPDAFSDDWLNLWYDCRSDCKDDYRFVYMGRAGTWTPFHADVMRSYSWSANVCGRKRWLLFPPGQEHLFTDQHGNVVYSVDHVDAAKYPRFHEAISIEVIQEPGQVLFVPSGWFHQVWNLEDTISINHNWCNQLNFDFVARSITDQLASIQADLSHLRPLGTETEWHEHCQRMLSALAGIDTNGVRQWIRVVRAHLALEDDRGDDIDGDPSTMLLDFPDSSIPAAEVETWLRQLARRQLCYASSSLLPRTTE
ncbi:hypothetical protein BC828DRAFT_374808 [Blastocladiella britannica]|nr:hypothetical protein BC828DRAFT_374808 [Blastocladiella britannica]